MTGPDEHFSEELWSDFVRGAVAPGDEAAMRAHLQAGCSLCDRTVELFSMVATAAAADLANPVPAHVTESARALFAGRGAGTGWAEKLERLAAALVWQQQPAWLPQGVRSAADGGQRVLYRAGDYSVDINLERPLGEPGEIVGQIANEADKLEALEGILVQVVSTGQTLVETATNRFGEFIIEYPAAKNAVLRLALRHRGQRIELPLHS